MVFWLWLQLLVFNLANQTLDPVEDKINKKSRPLPAGRISLRNAKVLRWSMQVLIIVWSASYSKEVLYATLAGSFLTWLYNEAGWAAGHWAGRNFCIGLGQGAWEVGCCLIAGKSSKQKPLMSVVKQALGKSLHTLDSIAINSILCSAAIFGTTIQAQDFKDTAGMLYFFSKNESTDCSLKVIASLDERLCLLSIRIQRAQPSSSSLLYGQLASVICGR